MKKVLVTGGSGFLGKRLSIFKPEWIYLSSNECDLTNRKQTRELFQDLKPSSIIHLASRVGGIKDNAKNQAEFYYQNTMINSNVLNEAHNAGVDRVLSSLSTCAFPNRLGFYPFKEESMFDGPPAETNFSYGMTKRMLQVASLSYRSQHGRNYSTFCPSNLYGPQDRFGDENSHFVPSLIHKIASSFDGDSIDLWGTGSPLRQQLYVDDLCEIIPILLEKHDSTKPLIVAPSESLSIKEMCEKLIKISGKHLSYSFNGNLDGQFRKDGSNESLLNLIGDFKFTSFEDGIKKTYNWYLENK